METIERVDHPTAPDDDAPHLLVVDDDTRIRNLLKQYLSENGFRVTVAGNSGEARRKLAGLDFDLLVLDVLKITKQSLARVLKQLIDTDHIVQLQGPRDRRQRELYPTAKGRALALALARPQSRRIRAALEDSGASERPLIERFLEAMVNPELRAQIDIVPANMSGKSHGDH